MRNLRPPFKFRFLQLVTKGRQHLNSRVEGIEINLPFVSLTVRPDGTEQKVAQEIVIRMADRRVLNASECCDNCIDAALASVQKIRSLLVDKQVGLASKPDGALYLVIEFMLEGIRQFLTFEQQLRERPQQPELWLPPSSDFRRPPDQREAYFAALEMLRAHLYRCLVRVAAIGQVSIPSISEQMRYDDAWQLDRVRFRSWAGPVSTSTGYRRVPGAGVHHGERGEHGEHEDNPLRGCDSEAGRSAEHELGGRAVPARGTGGPRAIPWDNQGGGNYGAFQSSASAPPN